MDGARGPEVERPSYDFYANPTLDEFIAQQGKGPITDVRVLHGNFWPEDEPSEDFLAALHEWRGHGQSSKSDPAIGKMVRCGSATLRTSRIT